MALLTAQVKLIVLLEIHGCIGMTRILIGTRLGCTIVAIKLVTFISLPLGIFFCNAVSTCRHTLSKLILILAAGC